MADRYDPKEFSRNNPETGMVLHPAGNYVTFDAYEQERTIVDRIWDILGRPSYEELDGRSIFDLVQGLKIAAEGYKKCHSIGCYGITSADNRCNNCKLMDSLPIGRTITPNQSNWKAVGSMMRALRSENNGL